jgi:hypothetical protein
VALDVTPTSPRSTMKPQHLLTTAAIALVVVIAYDKLYKKSA